LKQPTLSDRSALHRAYGGSLNYISWKLGDKVAADLKAIYTASTVEDAALRLDEFETQHHQFLGGVGLTALF